MFHLTFILLYFFKRSSMAILYVGAKELWRDWMLIFRRFLTLFVNFIQKKQFLRVTDMRIICPTIERNTYLKNMNIR